MRSGRHLRAAAASNGGILVPRPSRGRPASFRIGESASACFGASRTHSLDFMSVALGADCNDIDYANELNI